MTYALNGVNNPTKNNKFQQWLGSILTDEDFKKKHKKK
jgi:hypothetical protein